MGADPGREGPGSRVQRGGWRGLAGPWTELAVASLHLLWGGQGQVKVQRSDFSAGCSTEKLVLRPSVCGGLGWAGRGSRSTVPVNSGPAPRAGLWAASTPSLASPVGRTVPPALCQVSLNCTFPQWTHGTHRHEWALTHWHPTAPIPQQRPAGGLGTQTGRLQAADRNLRGGGRPGGQGLMSSWAGGLTWLGQPES